MTTTRRSTLSRPFSRRNKTLQGTGKRRRLFFETLEDRRVLAVSVLGSAASTGDNLTTETISSFNVPAGNDLALVVLGSGYGSLNSVNAFGGQAFSSVGTSSDALGAVGSLNTSIWIALLGDRGSDTTADVVANWTIDGDNEWKRISAIALSGVDQTNPTSSLISNSALADPHTLNVTSQVGDLVVDAIATGFIGGTPVSVPMIGANQTSLFSQTASGVIPPPPGPPPQVRLGFAASYEPGAATTAMSWSSFGNATNLTHIAANIVQAAAPTTVTLSTDALTISDTVGIDNHYAISYSGGTYTLTNPGKKIDVSAIAGAFGNGTDTVTFPDTGITSITVNGNGGNDKLTVDFNTGNPIPAGGISFDGGAGGNDSLVVTGYSLTTADGIADVAVTHLSSNSGTVTLAGLGTISFDEIEPLTLSGDAADLVITLPAGADSITLGDDGGPQDANGNTANTSAIYDSTGPAYSFEFTEFTNPTNSLTIHRGSAADDLTVLDLVASGFAASLTIGSAGSPFDQVTFSGPVTLGADKSLTAHASGTIGLSSSSSDLATSGTGSVSLTTAANITLASGSSITTVNGGITLEANQQMTPTAGNFIGLEANNSLIQTTGTGDIELKGRGGNDAGTPIHYGVYLHSGTSVSSTASGATAGTITIHGTGGAGTDNNYGAYLVGSTTDVTSEDGDISITGVGGDGSGGGNYGVYLASIETIASTGTGADAAKITIHGTGGNGTAINHGVFLHSSTTDVTSVDGDISITGVGNGSGNGSRGVFVDTIETIASTGTGVDAAKITIHGTGGNGVHNNYGVQLSASTTNVTSVKGDISITGLGNGSGVNNYGVYANNIETIASTGTGVDAAKITIHGTGGDGTSDNYGVWLSGSTTDVSSEDGDISITGVGGNGSGGVNYGVLISDIETIASTGTGADAAKITIHGTGGNEKWDNYGVWLVGSTTDVTSVDGDILITGVGGGDGSNSGNYGVYLDFIETIASTGTGADAAKITIHGTGGNGTETNIGVYLEHSTTDVTSVDGDILITGVGGGDGTGGDNHGVLLFEAGKIASTGTGANAAKITIHGTGGNGTWDNYGVWLEGGTTTGVTSEVGDILITGIGGGTQDHNYGVFFGGIDTIASTGTAKITIHGTGGNGTSNNYGVYLLGSTTDVTSVDGDISITGVGGGSDDRNYGVYLVNIETIASTGTGAAAATITIHGTGGNGMHHNYGVFLFGSTTDVTSVDGDISITGIGNGSGNNNYGVYLQSIDTIASTGTGADAAKITIHGTGGDGMDHNYGVYLSGSTTDVASVDGDISITGVGNGSGSGNYGVLLQSIETIASTGTDAAAATITIHGTGGSGTFQNHGVFVSGNSTSVASVDGAIEITGISQGTDNDNNGVYIFSDITLAIDATGSALIDITGNGAGTAPGVQIDSPISSGTGSVTIESVDDNIVFGAAGDLTSTSGTVTVTADTAMGNNGGAIFMANGAVIDAGSGMIALSADGDVTLGRLVTTNASDTAVTIGSTSGGVIDGGDTGGVDVETLSGRLVVNAATAIGSPSDAIETTVASLDLTTTATGANNGIWIAETDAVTVVDATTADGTIVITAGGTMTATFVTAGGTGRNVRLATSSGGDIALGLVTAAGDTVLLQAAGAITDGNGRRTT
jgi:hypothetical protein